MKLMLWTHQDGVRTTINPADNCLVCGVEPDVVDYFIRNLRRSSDGVVEKVRVGYWCHCGGVVVDGIVEGSSIAIPKGRLRDG